MAKTFWITGLSGAGKTTIGTALYNEIKKTTNNIVFLDGDILRETIAKDIGYTTEERIKGAYRYGGLCKLLASQNLYVICCTIAMYDEVRQWNRENIDNYIEIYIKVSKDTLIKRNQKGLYSSGAKNIVGIDLTFEEPKMPDLIINNDNQHIDNILIQLKQLIYN